MTASSEARLKELETALKCLQKLTEEQYETLSNDFTNRSESQFNLMKHLFSQYRALKEMVQMMALKLKVEEKQLSAWWTEAKNRTAALTIQDDLLEEYQKDLEKNNG